MNKKLCKCKVCQKCGGIKQPQPFTKEEKEFINSDRWLKPNPINVK